MRALKHNRAGKTTENREGSISEEELSEVAMSEHWISWSPSEISICLLEGKNQTWPLMRILVIISLLVLDHPFINKINLDESLRFEN